MRMKAISITEEQANFLSANQWFNLSGFVRGKLDQFIAEQEEKR